MADNIGGDGYNTHGSFLPASADRHYSRRAILLLPAVEAKRHINESVVSYIGDNVGLIPK